MEADLGDGGMSIIRSPITRAADHDRGIALGWKTQELVIPGGDDALHGAGVDPQHGGGGHEIAQSDVALQGGPVLNVEVCRRWDEASEQQLAKARQRLDGSAADLSDAAEIAVDVILRQIEAAGE